MALSTRIWRYTALLLCLAVALAGCQRVRARVELKKGNALYESESYREAVTQFQRGLELDPSATFAWRSVGFAALASYRPGDESAENLQYAKLAIDAFDRYLADHPNDQRVEEFLLSALLDAERYDEAIARLRKKAAANPDDPASQHAVVAVLVRAGKLEEAYAEATKATPRDANGLYSIGVAAWERLYRADPADAAHREALLKLGLRSLSDSLVEQPDFAEAMVYLNLLYRQQAVFEVEPELQQEALAEAEVWFQKAARLREQTKDRGS
jgi:tetratricopeptide (TPR) repeat protein